MRLGFHYHIPAIEQNSKIKMPGYLGRFVDSLANLCDEVICFFHSPLEHELEILDYQIKCQNVKLVNIGPHTSIPKRLWMIRKYFNELRYWQKRLDVLLIRAPTPLLATFAKEFSNLPSALLLVADYVAGVSDLPQPRWRKELIRLWALWNKWQQIKIARKSLTFVNSHLLFQELQNKIANLIETRTTTLSEKDFFIREDTCQAPPYRLLYTGRISCQKGLFEIVQALACLLEKGEDVVLDLVGQPEKGDSILDEIIQFANQKQIADRIYYHGFKPLGPELFKFYKQADIYVIASKSSFEGFPRTIWEAFSQSTPVIATKVGSIPFFLQHERDALLASPGKFEELAFLLKRVLTEPELRRHLIRNGRQLAQKNTLDSRAKEMTRHIEDWLHNRASINAY